MFKHIVSYSFRTISLIRAISSRKWIALKAFIGGHPSWPITLNNTHRKTKLMKYIHFKHIYRLKALGNTHLSYNPSRTFFAQTVFFFYFNPELTGYQKPFRFNMRKKSCPPPFFSARSTRKINNRFYGRHSGFKCQ